MDSEIYVLNHDFKFKDKEINKLLLRDEKDFKVYINSVIRESFDAQIVDKLTLKFKHSNIKTRLFYLTF
ncbi:MAG: hypothetical protein HFI85_05110 [Clostridia bacterium]|jgi:hypothetical protein|nr:hypothetical protein [Clostridia bacterium]